ncbi:hypothetical protein GGS26DRAFT_471524 [Hypomontagnella submonticulosa]|nr:hypothetical protein GGS26DRAFT_471524 [Hypomontagnella submonticulosa]
MLFSAVSSFAIMALAGQAVAEPLRQPYKLKLARMSTRSIFGLDRRQDEGYSPEQQFCGSGDTCAEACGKGFQQCASRDDIIHCFNKAGKQTCCPGLTGDSCDDGYFCTADDKGATWCCPDSMTLEQCASAYNLPGSLVSETAPAPSTPAPGPSTSASATTTTFAKVTESSSTKEAIVPQTTSNTSSTSSILSTSSTSSTSSSPVSMDNGSGTVAPTLSNTPASSAPAIAVTTSTSFASAAPSPTGPNNGIVTAGCDSTHAPVGGMVVLAAAAFAALL